MNTSATHPLILDNRVQFRAINSGNGKNKTRKVNLPLDMLAVLGWSGDKPVRIEFMDDGVERPYLKLSQVNAEEFGLVRKDACWKYAAD